ncbi:O-antigen ligase family protein [Mucilaginibacter sp. PAMB04168]|uniref:O-antigen ligase family protein n=1 Tax=Mucilaginibacter sp. PAMB04168 TaxID=3138567 RepID=UPI0031F604D7
MMLTKKIKTYSWTDLFYQPAGYLIMSLVALILSAAIIHWGVPAALTILGLVIGLPMVYAIVAYPKFGIMTLLISSYLIMWINRMVLNYPMGTVMDGLLILLVVGFIIKHKYDKKWRFLDDSVSIMMMVWILYNTLELFNPYAQSRVAWLFTIRTIGIVALTYYLFAFHIKSAGFIRLIFKTWIGLSAFAAVYAIFQEFHGFLPFEQKWLDADPSASSLYFQAGRWRRFGIFSDPVAAAYNMAISSLLCFVLIFVTKSVLKKITLVLLMMLFAMATLYAGIRGAFILLPAGLFLFFLLKLNAKTLILGIIFAMGFAVLIRVPTTNTALWRFQTAFRPSDDASFNVRKNNQKRIQPYIQTHPIGGGLGSTGTWGQRFSPGTYLASFPPDSGYVRVAVESGWIGLALLCALFFVILQKGITNYFAIQNNELKHYCLAMVLVVFALSIGNYPQEALVQFPINIYFYLAIALIGTTLKLDKQLQQNQQNHHHLKNITL